MQSVKIIKRDLIPDVQGLKAEKPQPISELRLKWLREAENARKEAYAADFAAFYGIRTEVN